VSIWRQVESGTVPVSTVRILLLPLNVDLLNHFRTERNGD
jgi:hypothetical protein